MSVKVLDSLVPYSSNIQLVIDRIAEILVYELANQRSLASQNGGNPADYDIRIYTDRFNPLDQFRGDKRSLVNIELSDASTQTAITANHGKQQRSVTINLYVYSMGVARETVAGHIPGDKDASTKVKKDANLIERILKADINSNLQFDHPTDRANILNSVTIQSSQYLMPDFDNRDFGHAVAERISITCNVIEQPMINNGVELESIVIDIEKDDTGLVYTTLEYDYTAL